MSLKNFMPSIVRSALGNLPTLHVNCCAACVEAGLLPVNRPGKTARDKKGGHIPYRRNIRVKEYNGSQWTGNYIKV